MRASVAELRRFFALADGTLLDGETWNDRHRRLTALALALALVMVGVSLAQGLSAGRLVLAGLGLGFALLAVAPWFGRSGRACCTAFGFAAFQVFAGRYIGILASLTTVWMDLLA